MPRSRGRSAGAANRAETGVAATRPARVSVRLLPLRSMFDSLDDLTEREKSYPRRASFGKYSLQRRSTVFSISGEEATSGG